MMTMFLSVGEKKFFSIDIIPLEMLNFFVTIDESNQKV